VLAHSSRHPQSWLTSNVSCMNKNAVICAIEYALRRDGCNEVPVWELYARVKETRGNLALTVEELIGVLKELEADGLFESLYHGELSEGSLIARSQTHPSVPINDATR
jgi:hypothetical protein